MVDGAQEERQTLSVNADSGDPEAPILVTANTPCRVPRGARQRAYRRSGWPRDAALPETARSATGVPSSFLWSEWRQLFRGPASPAVDPDSEPVSEARDEEEDGPPALDSVSIMGKLWPILGFGLLLALAAAGGTSALGSLSSGMGRAQCL